MRVAVLVSLIVHALAIAWFATRDGEAATRPLEQDEEKETKDGVAPPKEMIVEVVMLDEPRPIETRATPAVAVSRAAVARRMEAPAVPGTPIATPRRAGLSISAIVEQSASGAAERVPELAPVPARVLRADLSSIAERAAPPAAAVARDGELRPSGRGTYATDLGGSHWRSRTATAHVARDGTVKFEDAPDFDIHYAVIGVVGKFNADDWLARKAGIDPYASAKLKFLDRTREARTRIAEVHRAEDLAQAQRALQRNLDAARAIADPAARKQALFELWDDVAETGDAALVRAGAGVRAYLVGAIRAMRPAIEFTPGELAQLNARRRSRAVFAPYE